MPNPRTPRNLQLLKGENRPSRVHEEPDVPEAADLSPPDDLVGPESVQAWRSITANLGAARVLAQDDLMLLVHLCNLHGRCIRLWRAGESPTAAELTQLRLMFGEFGLSPASRSKAAQLPSGDEENPFLASTG